MSRRIPRREEPVRPAPDAPQVEWNRYRVHCRLHRDWLRYGRYGKPVPAKSFKAAFARRVRRARTKP